MCEYISHLRKFKKYKHTCKRETNNILNSENSLFLLKNCLNLNSKNSYTIYVFYRTDKSIQSSVKLDLKREKFDKKRLEKFKSEIVQGSEGYLELYIFDNNDSNDTKQFSKLFSLIHEFCDIDKINSDYDSNFTHNFKKLFENFLLFSYDILRKYSLVIIGIIFTSLIITIYTKLINHGYPYDLIDHGSVIFLTKFYLSLFGKIIIIFLIAIIIYSFFFKLNESNTKGEKIYKLILSTSFYLLLGALVYSIFPLDKDNIFLKTYNNIHIYPKLAKDTNNSYKLIIHDDMKKTYMYNVKELIDKNVTNVICKHINNYKTSTDLITAIMLHSKHIDIKNIILKKPDTSLKLLDNNLSQSNIVETLCAKE